MLKYFISLMGILCLIACQSQQNQQGTNRNNVAVSLSYPSVYTGTIPCADCMGIAVTLTLQDEHNAVYTSLYMGKSDSVFVDRGTYTIQDSILSLKLEYEQFAFAISGETLSMLDQDNQIIEGTLAPHYVLHKRKAFDFSGNYTLLGCDDPKGYQQSLSIKPEGEAYRVDFTASKIKDKANCSFSDLGTVRNDTLFVALSKPNEGVLMCIAPSHDQLGVEVFTQDFDKRYALMWYCAGGGSLGGSYRKSVATPDSVAKKDK